MNPFFGVGTISAATTATAQLVWATNDSPALSGVSIERGRPSDKVHFDYLGEGFFVEVEEGQIVISHPQWSLVGMGDSIGAALADLLEEARRVAPMLRDESRSGLSVEARKLRAFVLRVAE